MPIDWEPALTQRRGSRRRLGGLDVFHDFDWRTVFRHNRSAFPNGQSLADLVARECPTGKIPTLLLTTRTDVEAGIRETADRHIVVIPISDYLSRAGADAAATYYARMSGARMTQLPRLSDVVFSAPEFAQFLSVNLSASTLEAWAGQSDGNRQILESIVQATTAAPPDLMQALSALSTLEGPELEALGRRIRSLATEGGLKTLFDALTESPGGRTAAVAAVGMRIRERIGDIRQKVAEYNQLIATHGVTETQVQAFLEAAPWIVGLTYVRARARVEVPRGELDFVLDRYDGFHDLLELKGPDELIITEQRSTGDRPPPASAYSLGPALAKALAQAHLYRGHLDESRGLAAQYGLSDTRQARVVILVGRSTDLSDTCKEILRQLNLSLHRVEVIPYDVLGQRTEGWLERIERLLDSDSVVHGPAA